MKFNKLIFTLLFFLFTFFLFSCTDKPTGSQEHLEIVSLNDSIKIMVEKSANKLHDMKKIKVKLESKLEELEGADSTLSDLILSINGEIAKCEGMIKKNTILFNQHKKYIDAHENSALNASKIKMQHEQIKKDYYSISTDFLKIDQKMDEVQQAAKEYINTDIGMVIFHEK